MGDEEIISMEDVIADFLGLVQHPKPGPRKSVNSFFPVSCVGVAFLVHRAVAEEARKIKNLSDRKGFLEDKSVKIFPRHSTRRRSRDEKTTPENFLSQKQVLRFSYQDLANWKKNLVLVADFSKMAIFTPNRILSRAKKQNFATSKPVVMGPEKRSVQTKVGLWQKQIEPTRRRAGFKL